MINNYRQYLAGPGLGPLLIKTLIGSAGLRLVGMFFGFLVGVQLARGLGVTGYGVYGLAMSIIALLTVPTEFGLPQLVTREVAASQVGEDWGRLRGILKWSNQTVLLMSGAVSIAVTCWLIATGRSVNSALTITLFSGLLMVPLVALGNLRSAALRGLQHIVKGQLPDTLIRPASYSLFLFLAPLLAFPLEPAIAMALGVLSAAMALALSATMLRRDLPHEIHHVLPKIQSRAWWASALPMALTEGMRVLQGHLVILLLGLMATLPMVGVFRVASSIALLVAVPVTLLNIVGAPVIARLHAQGDKCRLQRLLGWFALGMTCCTLLLTSPFIVAGAPLLSFVFGEEFGQANVALLVLCGSALISGLYGANAVLLNMTGHQSCVTRASAVSLALLVLTAPLLILVNGEVGAAIASTISMTIWNVLMWRESQRLLALDTSILSFFKSL